MGVVPRCFALVPAAGVGTRSGADRPKQYVPLAGQAMIGHTLAALAAVPRIEATLVVLSAEDDQFEQEVPGFTGPRAWVARCGGTTRADTVANGLQVLREQGVLAHDWVLVHDAARCLLRPEWVDQLIDACDDDEVGGLLAVPVADTLKSVEGPTGGTAPSGEPRVAATVDRRGKWAAQTPQMFRWGLLAPALAGDLAAVTDEASAVEALGHQPRLVEASMENFKVTWPADFALAERLLRSR
ncbi:2-C-methyl-D-erythritol 4-phosphate cytidylyltransferase [Roseateles sp. YR242]|nr:2-C-methyl-D-erythritol 4-phosphate cytidylyltransferase [Roseateles sp. YR242]